MQLENVDLVTVYALLLDRCTATLSHMDASERVFLGVYSSPPSSILSDALLNVFEGDGSSPTAC